MLVIVPLWSAAPPVSVQAFFTGTEYNRTIFHFFGPPFMVARILPSLAAFGLAWRLPAHRRALALAVGCIVLTVAFTIVYIYPINAVLFEQAGGDNSPQKIAGMARRWIWADRLRFVVGTVAFAAILQAFRLPLPHRSPTGTPEHRVAGDDGPGILSEADGGAARRP